MFKCCPNVDCHTRRPHARAAGARSNVRAAMCAMWRSSEMQRAGVMGAPKQPGGGWWRSARQSRDGCDSSDAASAVTPAAIGLLPASTLPAPASTHRGENAATFPLSIPPAATPMIGAADCGRGRSTPTGWACAANCACIIALRNTVIAYFWAEQINPQGTPLNSRTQSPSHQPHGKIFSFK